MYDDIISLLQKHLNDAWNSKRIKIRGIDIFPIDNDTYKLMKTKLDATNTALRAIDKEYTINSLFRKRGEFKTLLVRTESDIYNINERLTFSNTGKIVVSRTIIDHFQQLSVDMHQLRGLVNGTNIEDLIERIEKSEINLNIESLSTSSNDSIYVINEDDSIE